MDQLSKESEKNYQMFISYLNMKVRSIPQLALDLNLPVKKIKTISITHNWEERAKNYDADNLKTFNEKKQKVIETLAEDQVSEEFLIKKLNNSLIKEILLKYLIQEQSSESINIDIKDLEKLANITKKQELSVNVDSGSDYSNLSDDELKQLKVLSSKIKDKD